MSAKVAPTLNPFLGNSPQARGAELKPFSWQDRAQRSAWIATVASAVWLVWAYWMTLADSAAEWDQPQYSHGWVLPLLSLYMMWRLRPNKAPSEKSELGLRVSAGVGLALIAAGQFVESLGFLQGIGLAAMCLGVFASILWGQPFAPFATQQSSGARLSHPEALWGVAAAGSVLAIAGVLGIGIGSLQPEMLSLTGMLVVSIGLVLVAVLSLPTTEVTWHELGAGVAVLLVATLVWLSGVHFDRMPLARGAFIASAIAAMTITGGVRLLRWAGPPVVFLTFMFPLPTLVERSVLGLLQTIAVILSEMVYTVIGVSAIRVGNQIELPGLNEDIQMEIAEACSGLSMTNILVAMVVAMVILMERPWWDRLILLLSALPIAIVSNVFRIVLTGLIWMLIDRFYASDPDFAASLRDPIHTWLGLIVMMPFALGLMLLELKLLGLLSVPEEDSLTRTSVMQSGGAPVR